MITAKAYIALNSFKQFIYWHILASDDVYKKDGRNLHTFYSSLNIIVEILHGSQQCTVAMFFILEIQKGSTNATTKVPKL